MHTRLAHKNVHTHTHTRTISTCYTDETYPFLSCCVPDLKSIRYSIHHNGLGHKGCSAYSGSDMWQTCDHPITMHGCTHVITHDWAWHMNFSSASPPPSSSRSSVQQHASNTASVVATAHPNVVVKFGLKEPWTNRPTRLLFPTPWSYIK